MGGIVCMGWDLQQEMTGNHKRGHPGSPQGSLENLGFSFILFGFVRYFLDFGLDNKDFSRKEHVFWASPAKAMQNHLEISSKNSILKLKHAKFKQKSEIGHVRTCQDLSRRTSTYCKSAEISFQKLHLAIFINSFIILENHVFLLTSLSFFVKSSVAY